MSESVFKIFDLSIVDDSYERPALEMLKSLRPNWPSDQVQFIVSWR